MLEERDLEVLDLLPRRLIAHGLQKLIDARIFLLDIDRRNVSHGGVDIVGIVALVEQRRLASFARAGADPFARINFLQSRNDGVHIICRLLDGEEFPLYWRGGRAAEEAVFDRHRIGVQHRLQLAATACSARGVTFGVQHHGAVEPEVRNENVLLKFFAIGMRVIEWLFEDDFVGFLGSAAGLNRSHFDRAGNFLQLGLQIGSRRGLLRPSPAAH